MKLKFNKIIVKMNALRLPFLYILYKKINSEIQENTRLMLNFESFNRYLYRKFVKYCYNKGKKDVEIMLEWTILTFSEVTNDFIGISTNINDLYIALHKNNYDTYFNNFDKFIQKLDKYINYEYYTSS